MTKARIHLTRGIAFRCHGPTGRVALGGITESSLSWIPLQVWVTLVGSPDRDHGMLVNVRDINKALAEHLARNDVTVSDATELIDWVWDCLAGALPDLDLAQVRCRINGRLSLAREAEFNDMVLLTREYEIAAAHCLRDEQWDDEQNFGVFGKCANRAGHGHNYTIQVGVRLSHGRQDAAIDAQHIDEVVKACLIEPFDHKNLNTDCPQFRDVLPTVENMVQIFWTELDGQFAEQVTLARVAVWETPTTFAEYFGPEGH